MHEPRFEPTTLYSRDHTWNLMAFNLRRKELQHRRQTSPANPYCQIAAMELSSSPTVYANGPEIRPSRFTEL